ncbi:MAG: CBS domain-containing protein [Rhodospirillales bacterium]|nr:CBS domain-containing protein [Gemmatimonadota bacterium]MDH3472867.1 CBS domain-containing protein [Rhodospirillales bacterium]
MQVSEILQSKGERVVAIEPNAKVRDVASTLRRERIGAALVRDRDGALLGIVSERDIVRSIAEEGSEALSKSAADLMSRSVVTCRPESSTEELMEQMLAERIRHLPVYEDDELVGIISIVDVVKGVLTEMKWREKVLQQQVVTAVGWSTDED